MIDITGRKGAYRCEPILRIPGLHCPRVVEAPAQVDRCAIDDHELVVHDGVLRLIHSLKVHGKLLACVPANRSAEPASLVVHVDFDDRAELLDADPAVYYVTDHYVGYSAVLVRLSRVDPDALRDLLGMAYKFVTRRAAPRSPARMRR